MPFRKLKSTPRQARVYLFFGFLLIALPSILSLYNGHEGKFLVATGMLGSTPFEKSVIYINRHDVWGAHGVIINKPVPTRDFRHEFPELEWHVDLYNAGPVHYARDNFLLLPTEEAPNGFLITAVEKLKEERPDVIAELEEGRNQEPLRLYLGFAGWGALQLNREIVRGAWGVIDYDPTLMFKTPPEDVWRKAIKRVLEERPADISGI